MLDQIMKSYVISSLMWLLLFYSQEQRQIKGRRIVVFSWACLETLLCGKKKAVVNCRLRVRLGLLASLLASQAACTVENSA